MISKNEPSLHYDRQLEAAERVFGRENVVARVYERDKLVNKNIFDDFLSVIAVSLPGEVAGARAQVNYTPCLDDLDFMILSNTFEPTGSFHDAVLDVARRLDDFSPGRRRPGISRALLDGIREQFRESNAVAARRHFGNAAGQLFTQGQVDPVDDRPPERGGDIDLRRAVQLLTGIVVRQEQAIGNLRDRVAQLDRRLKAADKAD